MTLNKSHYHFLQIGNKVVCSELAPVVYLAFVISFKVPFDYFHPSKAGNRKYIWNMKVSKQLQVWQTIWHLPRVFNDIACLTL